MTRPDPNTIIDRAWSDWISQLPMAAINRAGYADWFALAAVYPNMAADPNATTNEYLNAWEACMFHIWYAFKTFDEKPDARLTPTSIGKLNAMAQWINGARKPEDRVTSPLARRGE